MCIVPDNDPWLQLAIVVVQQAVLDYKVALFDRSRGEEQAFARVEDLERWFLSEEGQIICLGQGEHIIRKVKEEVRRGNYK